jgi:hypothetical protein
MRPIIMALMLASLVAFAVAGAAWVLVAPPPAKAAFPGQNGRKVFWRLDSAGFVQTRVADKDLSDQVKLTSESADSGLAVWKPGSAKLAFDSNRADPDPTDARDRRHLQDEPRRLRCRQADRLGVLQRRRGLVTRRKKIAFNSDRRNHQGRFEIHVMNSDGTNVRRVTTLPADAMFDLAPRFSPDGRRLVFTRYITDPGRSALFTVRADGGGLKQLTPWGNGASDADWSPEGKKLVFEATPNKRCFGEIYTVNSATPTGSRSLSLSGTK